MKSSIYHLYKEPNLESDFGPNVGAKIFLVGYASTFVASYDCVKFQEKSMIQTQENGEKPPFGPDFAPIEPKFELPIFFSKSGFVTRYHGQLFPCKILEKTNDPIFRKYSDGRKERRTGLS